jgi:hypothetical protein
MIGTQSAPPQKPQLGMDARVMPGHDEGENDELQ